VGRHAVDRDHLEEEPVQVERVIHPGLVHDVPDLQLAHLHRRVVVVLLVVDEPVVPVEGHARAETHDPGRLDRSDARWAA
jgi:hypothetical protein